jgi:hypothetical protein
LNHHGQPLQNILKTKPSEHCRSLLLIVFAEIQAQFLRTFGLVEKRFTLFAEEFFGGSQLRRTFSFTFSACNDPNSARGSPQRCFIGRDKPGDSKDRENSGCSFLLQREMFHSFWRTRPYIDAECCGELKNFLPAQERKDDNLGLEAVFRIVAVLQLHLLLPRQSRLLQRVRK